MTDTETIQTAYGDVEIETVDCDSCGQTIGKDDANEFTLSDREGHACDHCVDNGPISFPPTVDFNVEPAEEYWLGVLLWPAGMIFISMDYHTDKAPKRLKEWHAGAVGALLWTTLLLLLLHFGVI